MVVGLALAAVQMGMALPTGFLFGVGYGTGVRVGYEQVYPLLFPKGARQTTSELTATMKGMNTVYDAIGGKDASRMGIAVGITNAGEILKNPDFRVLEQLELSSSGPTSSSSNRSRSGLDDLAPSVSSPDEIVAEEIAEFNKLTNAEIWAKVRAMSTGQIINSRTGQGMSSEWMDITGKVLLERTQSNFTGPSTSVVKHDQTPFHKTSDTDWLTWNKNFQSLISQFTSKRAYIKSMNAKISQTTGSTRIKAVAWRAGAVNAIRTIVTKLRVLSNDYRNPNNNIRTSALLIRKQLAAGHFKY